MNRTGRALRIAWTSAMMGLASAIVGLLVSVLSCGNEVNPAVGPRADLIVSRLSIQPAAPDSTQAITATIVVRNRGAVAAPATRASVSVDGSTTCADAPIPALGPGQSDSVTCDIGRRAEALHSLGACCDITSAVAESSETNNCSELPFQVQGAQPPPWAPLRKR
jgi:subtilase family serine protease